MNENDSLAPPAPLALRGVNVSEALARFAGSEERLRHWLQDFCQYGPDTACQIRTAIETGAHEQAIRLAHACKGRCGMLGMAELHSIAQSLEMTLKNGEPTDLWLEELERTVLEMSQQIAGVLGETPA
jgi:HPt (histidine-containing phosphotransfer) domain-containing protein